MTIASQVRHGASVLVLATVMIFLSPPVHAQAETGLTLDRAIALAFHHSPVLGAASARARAATATRSQAGALPNPEISIEADNIYGDYDGTSRAEITYGVSQMIEMPGKRGNRLRMAAAAEERRFHETESIRLDLIRDVTIAFAEIAAAQQDILLLEEEQALATSVRDSVSARVDAGKEPPIQKNKAEIAWSASMIALDRARRLLEGKQQALHALTGGAGHHNVDAATLPAISEPDALDVYRSRLLHTPDAHAYDADIHGANASLSYEKAQSVPDPTLNLGIKDIREDGAQAFVAGVSFPLPVFNVNRSGIERAGHDLNAALLDQRSARLALESDLVRAYGDFSSAYAEVTALQASVIPGATEAFDFARQGYEAGKFSYLEVLDAQRTLFDARRQLNQAILEYQRQRAVIERIAAINTDYDTAKEHNHE